MGNCQSEREALQSCGAQVTHMQKWIDEFGESCGEKHDELQTAMENQRETQQKYEALQNEVLNNLSCRDFLSTEKISTLSNSQMVAMAQMVRPCRTMGALTEEWNETDAGNQWMEALKIGSLEKNEERNIMCAISKTRGDIFTNGRPENVLRRVICVDECENEDWNACRQTCEQHYKQLKTNCHPLTQALIREEMIRVMLNMDNETN